MSEFRVVSLVLEEPEIVETFASHYLAQGAAGVDVYYDADDIPEGFTGLPGLTVHACDADFWTSAGGERSHDLIVRQHAVFRHAYERCPTGWMLVTDCDEFISGSLGIRDMLDRVPDDVIAVNIPTAEAVYGPGDDPFTDFGATHFRLPVRPRALGSFVARPLYRKRHKAFRRCLLAHSSGKSFVRAGCKNLRIGCHDVRRNGKPATTPLRAIPGAAGKLRSHHFDAVSFGRWKEKWRRRVEDETDVSTMAPERRMQMAEVAAAMRQGDDALLRVFRAYYGLSRGQYALMRSMGVACRRDVLSARGGTAPRADAGDAAGRAAS